MLRSWLASGLILLWSGAAAAQDPGPQAKEAQAPSVSILRITNNATEDYGIGGANQNRFIFLGVNASGLEEVRYWNGTTAAVVHTQDNGSSDHAGTINTVFNAGSGASAGSLLGAWRHGTDFPWIWTSAEALAKAANITNPLGGSTLNPEDPAAIADGCLFWEIQTPSAVGSENVPIAAKLIFKVDVAANTATNLTGTDYRFVATDPQTSGCKAVWIFDSDKTDDNNALQVMFYDGTDPAAAIPVGEDFGFYNGKVVSVKPDGDGIYQVYLYDTNLPSPSLVQLTNYTDPNRRPTLPRTDGRHVAWMLATVNPITLVTTSWDLVLNGEVVVTGATNRPPVGSRRPFVLDQGQLAWVSAGGKLYYSDGTGTAEIDTTPVSNVTTWAFSGGFIPFGGSDGADGEIFLATGTAPAAGRGPMLVDAEAGNHTVTLRWAKMLTASSYNVYYAKEPGVTKANYTTKTGGTKVTGAVNPLVLTGLTNEQPLYFVVTAVESGVESAESMEVSATPRLTWMAISSVGTSAFYAAAADPLNPLVAYAAGGNSTYRSADGGFTWTALSGGIEGHQVRALAARGSNVYAASSQPAERLLRSTNSGTDWTIEVEGGNGEQNKAVAISPSTPATLYAGDLETADFDGAQDSRVIKSVDSGDNWTHIVQPSGMGDLLAYAIAIEPGNASVVYVGGTGVPVAKTIDGGTSWNDISPVVSGFFYALAINPSSSSTVYAATANFRASGIYKTVNGGAAWDPVNNGLPEGDASNDQTVTSVFALAIDPASPNKIWAGTANGIFLTLDGGANWSAYNFGLSDQWIYSLAITGSGTVIAGTSEGLFVLGEAAPAEEGKKRRGQVTSQ